MAARRAAWRAAAAAAARALRARRRVRAGGAFVAGAVPREVWAAERESRFFVVADFASWAAQQGAPERARTASLHLLNGAFALELLP
jgi:hypothetical protein